MVPAAAAPAGSAEGRGLWTRGASGRGVCERREGAGPACGGSVVRAAAAAALPGPSGAGEAAAAAAVAATRSPGCVL